MDETVIRCTHALPRELRNECAVDVAPRIISSLPHAPVCFICTAEVKPDDARIQAANPDEDDYGFCAPCFDRLFSVTIEERA
jgi:hypothetical protein